MTYLYVMAAHTITHQLVRIRMRVNLARGRAHIVSDLVCSKKDKCGSDSAFMENAISLSFSPIPTTSSSFFFSCLCFYCRVMSSFSSNIRDADDSELRWQVGRMASPYARLFSMKDKRPFAAAAAATATTVVVIVQFEIFEFFLAYMGQRPHRCCLCQ